MGFDDVLITDSDIDLYEQHLRKKEQRYVSMERQRCHKQRLLRELVMSNGFKPSIHLKSKWNDEIKAFISTNRIKRGKRSGTQKFLKKVSCRMVRHIPIDAIPHKGNHYRKVFDYWNQWI